MSMDEFLNKPITIKQGLDMGIVSAKVLTDFDIFQRVQTMMSSENLPKTHAVERVAEGCKVCETTVWTAFSATSKLIAVR